MHNGLIINDYGPTQGPQWQGPSPQGQATGSQRAGRYRVDVVRRWQRRRLWRFMRESLGQTVQLDRDRYTIVGVAPAGFALPEKAELWRPIEMDARFRTGELGELLAASPAGRAQLGPFGQDDGLRDLPVAGGDHGPDGGRLGALADRVGGVLHVAAGVETAARGPEACPDPEARVRRMGVGEGPARQVEHRPDPCIRGAGASPRPSAHRSFT